MSLVTLTAAEPSQTQKPPTMHAMFTVFRPSQFKRYRAVSTLAAAVGQFGLACGVLSAVFTTVLAQTPAPAPAATPAAASQPAQSSVGTAGALLDNAQATRFLAGYWRVLWSEDPQNMGVLHITGLNTADNLTVFEGSYSQDGFNTCPVQGSWVYSTRAAYATGGAANLFDLPNYARLRISCPTKELNLETPVIVGSTLVLAGRATVTGGGQVQMVQVRLRRFSAAF